MPTYRHGRHEHGQNFLTDRSTIDALTRLTAGTTGPIIEIGSGGGALTTQLAHLRRPLTGVEIDPQLADQLRARMPTHVRVIAGDFLTYRLPTEPHVLVGNLPFHQTTALLRRILHAPAWTDAILLVQWEVARRRAGVGGSSMMTTQWAPWFEFTLHGRVPARAFTPRPGVDGGILTIQRRSQPLLPAAHKRSFQALVHRVYTGPGNGLGRILARTTPLGSARAADAWLAARGIEASALPRQMRVDAWVDLFKTTGVSPPQPAASTRRGTRPSAAGGARGNRAHVGRAGRADRRGEASGVEDRAR